MPKAKTTYLVQDGDTVREATAEEAKLIETIQADSAAQPPIGQPAQ